MAGITARQKESIKREYYLKMARDTYSHIALTPSHLIGAAKAFREFVEGAEAGDKPKPAAAAKRVKK